MQSNNRPNMPDLGEHVINAWQSGEATGNYNEFKGLLSNDFDQFAHPLFGRFSGTNAKGKMLELIDSRQKVPNTLSFSEVNITSNETFIMVSFHSKGKVMGGQHDYEGHNVISFKIKDGKVAGFCEYLGDDDLLKFAALKTPQPKSNENQ